MPLTDTTIRNAKPKARPYKLHDARGLFLLIKPTGSKLWRCRYQFEGREKQASFGAYPDVSLKLARERRDAIKKAVAEGRDPNAKADTFESTGTTRTTGTTISIRPTGVELTGRPHHRATEIQLSRLSWACQQWASPALPRLPWRAYETT